MLLQCGDLLTKMIDVYYEKEIGIKLLLRVFILSLVMIGMSSVSLGVQAANFKEISLTSFDDVWFGNVQDDKAKAGVTIQSFFNR